jgi:hypothetical protein
VGHPLWREVGSVVFSFCWASPAQPFTGLSPTGLMSIFYCLCFWNSPNPEGQVPVFISPRNKVAQLYSQALGWPVTIWASSFLYIKFFFLWSSVIYDSADLLLGNRSWRKAVQSLWWARVWTNSKYGVPMSQTEAVTFIHWHKKEAVELFP